MQIFVKIKKIGRRRASLERRAMLLDGLVAKPTLAQLLASLVAHELDHHAARTEEQPTQWLSELDLDDAAAAGKVGFGARYNPTTDTLEVATERVLLAFQDGLFAVFINGHRAEALDTILDLPPDSEMVLVRLALLRGG